MSWEGNAISANRDTMVRYFIILLFLSWTGILYGEILYNLIISIVGFSWSLGFCLRKGQNLLGTRAGTIERGAKTFYSRKKVNEDFFQKNIRVETFLDKFFPKPSLCSR